MAHIRKQSKLLEFVKGKLIQEKGVEIKGLYFIIEGAILEEYPNG